MAFLKDLLHQSPGGEKKKHKTKHLVQSPNYYFMGMKCPAYYKITILFNHAPILVLCVGCSTVLCQPMGGKARFKEGYSFSWKQYKKHPESRLVGNYPNKNILV
ncbi:40S ribosomal protein S27-like [Meles meles]|uniref:40S ribosomal protein S27-like n=1 Tax=Meles meles TaxID=9662 RepID=UPI001E699EC1|nr:40S ribosomal protein S27-like [Meles meles]